MLIGSHPEVEGIGEVNAFERRLWPEVSSLHHCSCGQVFADCDFWRGVLNPIDTGNGNIAINSELLDQFEIANHKLFRQVLSVSGKSVVCDSSKDVHRLKKILACPSFNPVVVYLVRDPRAVAYSMVRKGERVGESGRKKYQFLQGIKMWRNLQSFMLENIDELKCPHITIRYEDLVSNTEAYMNQVFRIAGLKKHVGDLQNFESPVHYIEGNRIRFNKNHKLCIDAEFQSALSDENWIQGTELAKPFLSQFGYPTKR